MSNSRTPHDICSEPAVSDSLQAHPRKGTGKGTGKGSGTGGHPSMTPTGPRATHQPVDNPPAAAPTVMDGDDTDLPLFDGYEPPSSDGSDELSAGRRLTLRQAGQIADGVHPLTLNYTLPLRLHPDADRTRTVDSRQDGSPTCGTCASREQLGYRRSYPKCTRPGAPVSSGPATDVRAWWPGCTHHAPRADA